MTHLRPIRRATFALLLLAGAALALVCVASAGPRTVISDPDAEPSWTGSVAGAGAGVDVSQDVLIAGNGDVFIAGSVKSATAGDDISLSKFHDHALQWTKTWDGAAHGDDSARKLALSPDGKWIYVAGQMAKATGTRIVVLKRATSNGALKWSRTWDGAKHRAALSSSVGVDGAGNVVVSGAVQLTALNVDYALVSWTASGKLRWSWSRDVGAHGPDYALDEVVSSDGTTYVTGIGPGTGGLTAAMTARVSGAGKTLWVRMLTPAASGGILYAAAPRPRGGVYVCGAVDAGPSGMAGMVASYTPKGAVKKYAPDTLGGAASVVFRDLAVTTGGQIVAVGAADAAGARRPRVVAYNPGGSVFGTATIAGPGDDAFVAVAADAAGGFCAVGTEHLGPASQAIAAYRGSTVYHGGLWSDRWYLVGTTGNEPTSVAARGTTVAVAGKYESGGPTGIDQALLVYSY